MNREIMEKVGSDRLNRTKAMIRVEKLVIILGVILCVFLGGCAKVTVRVLAESSGSSGNPPGPKCDLEEKSLVLDQFKQVTGQWCWAASAQMIINHHKKLKGEEPISQCEIVNKVFTGESQESCCPDGGNDISRCQQGWWPEDALTASGFQTSGRVRSPDDQEDLWNKLTRQICANQPVIYEEHWPGGGGHTNVIYGYRGQDGISGRWVEMYDPLAEPGQTNADALIPPDFQQVHFDNELVFVPGRDPYRSSVYYLFDIQSQ